MEHYSNSLQCLEPRRKGFMANKGKGIEADFIYSSENRISRTIVNIWRLKPSLIDSDRLFMSVSREQICQDPFLYWNYIPIEVKHFFVRTAALIIE
ncbi:MAG: Trifunctional NAD biosynthesis/regulator protein NadR [Sodalis sp.]|nr:MAG: Trifunctional NAD biosynthesis/regulator protein NadR [Sodalis sp.]